jgi:serine/threonine-protein kinase
MGVVYKAEDTNLKRPVALKFLAAHLLNDGETKVRFRREAEAAAALSHPNIAVIHDINESDGHLFIAMEFVEGVSVGERVAERPLKVEESLDITIQAAQGLQAAHESGIAHRDIKSANLMVTPKGQVKIMDFGLARRAQDAAASGVVMGTPFYMAPEQAQGLETLDHRADVWALAAITYECVTGGVPFRGNNGPSILLEILTKEPTAVSVAGKGRKHPVPPTLDRVMSHAFRKQAAGRIASVGDFANALGAAYGLAGEHREWAQTPQAKLGELIQAKLPQLMVAAPMGPPMDVAADSFFGESSALDAMSDPFAEPVPPPVTAVAIPDLALPPAVAGAPSGAMTPVGSGANPATQEADDPVVVPTASVLPILVAALVGIGALAVGILAAWYFLG